jgi:hypothetical protein
MGQINANFNAIQNCNPPPCDGVRGGSNPTNASTSMQGGQAVFENNNYRITAGDNNTVTINNKKTGETYEAWGDPHMKVDGQQDFDFWGKTTFALEDGTKVTIDTTPFKDNPSTTLSSKVTITNGDYGVQISGVDTNKVGDLKIDEAKGYGRVLDAVVTDGNTVQENPAGRGFVAVDEQGKVRKVDQEYINKTDETKTGKLQDKHQEAFEKLRSLISIAFEGVFLGNHGSHCGRGSDEGGHRGGGDRDGHRGGNHNGGVHRGGNPWGNSSHHWGQPECRSDNGNRDHGRRPSRDDDNRITLPRIPGPLPGTFFSASADLFSARIELKMSRMQ